MVKDIVIPFSPAMVEAALTGLKLCTSRNKVYGYMGDCFFIGNTRFQIIGVQKMPLYIVVNYLYIPEGFGTPEEFKETWLRLHPRKGLDPNHEVYVHFFRRC